MPAHKQLVQITDAHLHPGRAAVIALAAAFGGFHIELVSSEQAVELRVSDTGPGIPESERERVLECFVRLQNSRNTPGNGLGLSLVRAVAIWHNAQLRLDDAWPGLVVSLRFPRLNHHIEDTCSRADNQ